MKPKKNTHWIILKDIITVDKTLPNNYGGRKFVYHSTFEGSEAQVDRYATSLEKKDPMCKEQHSWDTTNRYPLVEYIIATEEWVHDTIKGGVFKIEGYVKQENYDDLSREELIQLLKNRE